MPVTRHRLLLLTCIVGLLAAHAAPRPGVRGAELPARLTDQAFWKLSADASEPGGYFRSHDITNLTSNELWFQYVIPDLVTRTRSGGVYLGVGPEQNFTYMAAIDPRLAIIFDIRRGNLDMQLLYKAIFELAKDRADFMAMLFSRPRPSGLGPQSTAVELFGAFAASRPSAALFDQHLAAIEDRLLKVHGLPLPASDLAGVRTIYRLFHQSGYALRASPTYADLMTATDEAGVNRSYLATEAAFARLKDLESRNLVVPVVGDFGGPKAIRAIGAYLKSQGATVSAFYLSNVEQYLYQDGKWDAFCRNVARLPLDGSSTFIRTANGGGRGFNGFGRGGGFITSLGPMAEETSQCGGR
jgi:hypothetical protein